MPNLPNLNDENPPSDKSSEGTPEPHSPEPSLAEPPFAEPPPNAWNRFKRSASLLKGKLQTQMEKRFSENLKDKIKNSLKEFSKLKEILQEKIQKGDWKKLIQEFDPQASVEWITQAVQKRGASFYGTLATVLLSTYFVADLTSLVVESYIPEPPLSRMSRLNDNRNRAKSLTDYNVIFSRNLFNSQGIIPGEESTNRDSSGPPIKSSLPLNLIGTLVMANETLSIATIEDKNTHAVYAVRIEDEIEGKAQILKVEPNRVIFLNTNSGRREYIELPEDQQAPASSFVGSSAPQGPGIEKVAPSQFNVSRQEVDKALSDFNNILTQARAVPNIENGIAAGYKLFQIVPGSIYDKLGLQNGDLILGLNGQPINDPGKAFEMLNELKTTSHMELQVKRDGKPVNYVYEIH